MEAVSEPFLLAVLGLLTFPLALQRVLSSAGRRVAFLSDEAIPLLQLRLHAVITERLSSPKMSMMIDRAALGTGAAFACVVMLIGGQRSTCRIFALG